MNLVRDAAWTRSLISRLATTNTISMVGIVVVVDKDVSAITTEAAIRMVVTAAIVVRIEIVRDTTVGIRRSSRMAELALASDHRAITGTTTETMIESMVIGSDQML